MEKPFVTPDSPRSCCFSKEVGATDGRQEQDSYDAPREKDEGSEWEQAQQLKKAPTQNARARNKEYEVHKETDYELGLTKEIRATHFRYPSLAA